MRLEYDENIKENFKSKKKKIKQIFTYLSVSTCKCLPHKYSDSPYFGRQSEELYIFRPADLDLHCFQ